MSFRTNGAIEFRFSGGFDNIQKLLKKSEKSQDHILNKYGKKGVDALMSATPKDTGLTARSWTYEIERNDGGLSIVWSNSNIQNGVNIAVILQYGHGTKNGGYVAGRDYINPAIQPIFDDMIDKYWKEVTE